ncbi:MAG: flagellar hook-length control protein FliK [Thermodesulfobacteriota bacterium]
MLKGEIVQARVLESNSLGRALLLLKGKQMNARTHVPLPKGSVLSFRVQKLSPIPMLKIIGMPKAPAERFDASVIRRAIEQNVWKTVREHLPQSGLPREASTSVRRLMDFLSMRLFMSSPSDLLQVLIEQSGFAWEGKLRRALRGRKTGRDGLNKLAEKDLKGLCSKLISLDDEESGQLQRLHSVIQNVQLLNKFGLAQKRMLFFPIPFQFPDGLYTVGQLLIKLPQGETNEQEGTHGKAKGSFQVTFLLELSRLGPLKIDLTLRGKDVWATIMITRKDARDLIENAAPGFINRMKETGLSIHSLECRCTKPEIVTPSLMEEILPQEEVNTISFMA